MDSIRKRITTVAWAKGHRGWLLSAAVSALLAALGYLWPQVQPLFSRWIVVPPPDGGGVMTIFGQPIWLFLIGVSAACLMGWLFESLHKAHQELTPRFAAWFDQDNGGISETFLARNTGEFVDDAKYLRITVQGISQRSVEVCEASLVKIERRLSPTSTEVVWDQDSLPLVWAVIHSFEAKIHYQTKRFVDVGRILKKSGLFKLRAAIPNRLATKIQGDGVYIVTVVVTGDGVSQSVPIEIETDGTFDGFAARPAPSTTT